jgi:hypothetical protein
VRHAAPPSSSNVDGVDDGAGDSHAAKQEHGGAVERRPRKSESALLSTASETEKMWLYWQSKLAALDEAREKVLQQQRKLEAQMAECPCPPAALSAAVAASAAAAASSARSTAAAASSVETDGNPMHMQARALSVPRVGSGAIVASHALGSPLATARHDRADASVDVGAPARLAVCTVADASVLVARPFRVVL